MNTSLILSKYNLFCCFTLICFFLPTLFLSAHNENVMLNCNATITLALDENCEVLLTPDLVLSDVFMDYSDFILEIDEVGSGNSLTISDIGSFDVLVTDLENNTCSGEIVIEDNSPPVILAESISSVILQVTPFGSCSATLTADSLDNGSYDNCGGPLEFLIQNPSLGLGQTNPFPFAEESTTFDNSDFPFVNVDLWVGDNMGNWSYKIIAVAMVDNQGPCSEGFFIKGKVVTEENDPIENVELTLIYELENAVVDTDLTTNDGFFTLNNPFLPEMKLIAERNDTSIEEVLNGVSTYDIVAISKHILGMELLDSPYKMLAADVNNSGTISSADLVDIRKVILFIEDGFPNANNWRIFDPANTYGLTDFKEEIYIDDSNNNSFIDFIGVKMGDVNSSANSYNFIGEGDTRNMEDDLTFLIKDQVLSSDEFITIDFKAKDFKNLFGYQFTLQFNPFFMEFVDCTPQKLPHLGIDNFGFQLVDQGIITTSWNGIDVDVTDESTLFTLKFKTHQNGRLSEQLSISTEYLKAEAYIDHGFKNIQLSFDNTNSTTYKLYQNQPNPFSTETLISFVLPQADDARLSFFDLNGQLLFQTSLAAVKGYNEFNLNKASLKKSGLLYYQLETNQYTEIRKMLVH